MIGSTLSHYKVLERLGEGGTGSAWKALDLDLARLVAIKLLAPEAGFGDEARRRLLAQAAAASALGDPQLCAILETGETGDGQPYVVTPFCEGETLADRLRQAPLLPSRTIDLAGRIAAAVARAHAHGIVHGDLKPGNVLLTPEGEVRLVDFGQAGLARPADAASLAYRSPEQLRALAEAEGGAPLEAGPAGDVWALGVLLYQMLSGRLPYAGASAAELLQAIDAGPPPPLSAAAPPALAPILAAALARDPARRYSDAAELRDDLAAAEGTHLLPASLGTTLLEMPLAGFEVTERGSAGGHAGEGDVRSAGEAGLGASSGQRVGESSGQGSAMIGRTIAHYRILDHLGTGGMGVVYKAADTKLERTVALKFLPYALTRDQRAKERFLQEARAASSLDHPNICTIHEVGETPEGQLYLAMACYEGETLGRRIERGPLPIPEAIDIARQTAQGLAKAHRAGIVHRDVKPANLMLTSDGLVKILDFGIAKLARAAAGATRVGFAVGTPAYMSPEQARGEDVDPRTDVWALGVVLYEMLTAERPFRGADREAVVASLQRDEPPRLATLRPDVPPELERIVARMLAKSPDDRYPTIAEAQADLAALQAVRAPADDGRRSPLLIGLGAAAALALLVIAGYLFLHANRKPQLFQAESTTRITDQEGRETYPSLSPDARNVVYTAVSEAGTNEIYLQSLAGGSPKCLTANIAESCSEPAFSPNGRQIAFRSEHAGGGIFLMDTDGGRLHKILPVGYDPAWRYDGKEIAFSTDAGDDPSARQSNSQLGLLSLATGRWRWLHTGDAVQPSWSPHGRRIAYWGLPAGSGQRGLWTAPVGGGEPLLILADENFNNWDPVWSPDGEFLYFASDRTGNMNLWRVPIDEKTGKKKGPIQQITTSSQWNGFLSISKDGRRMVYAAHDDKTNIEAVAFDPVAEKITSPIAQVTTGTRAVRTVDVSPDGEWLAFDTSVPHENIAIVRRNGHDLRTLIADANKNRVPRWAPDGRTILFYSNRGASTGSVRGYDAWTIRPDGGGLRELTQIGSVAYPLWSPRDRRLVYSPSFNTPGATSNAAAINLDLPLAERRPQPLPPEPHGYGFAPSSWSPDGLLLLGGLSQPDRSESGLCLFSWVSGQYSPLPVSGSVATWLHDSHRFLYIDAGKIFLFDLSSRRSRLLLAPPAHSSFIAIGVAPDDRTLYPVLAENNGDIFLMDVKAP